MAKGHDGKRGMPVPASSGLLTALGMALVVALLLGAGAIFLFSQPAERSAFVERFSYDHVTSFKYSVKTEPATIYPGRMVGPVVAGEDGLAAEAPPPIYTKLARTLDVGFTYALEAPVPADVSGEVSAALEISAGEDGWRQTSPLLPPRPFRGATVSANVSVDVQDVLALIETIEEETDFSAGTYDVAVVPTVRVAGRVGEDAIEQAHSVPFVFRLNRTQVTPEAQLVYRDTQKVGETRPLALPLTVLGLSFPFTVVEARNACLAGTSGALAVAIVLGAVILLDYRRSEEARLRLRHGLEVISVADSEFAEATRVVRLATMDDLARLAKRDGGVVFRHLPAAGSPSTYFVQEGDVIYCVRPSADGSKAPVASEEAVKEG